MAPPRTNPPGGGPGSHRAGRRGDDPSRPGEDPRREDLRRGGAAGGARPGTRPDDSPLHGVDPYSPEEDQRARDTFLQLTGTVEALMAAADAGRSVASGAYSVAERDAARRAHREAAKAAADGAEAYEEACQVLLGRAARLAPWLAAAPWDAPEWRSADWLGAGAARYVRIGALHVPGASPDGRVADLPALVPLLDGGNLGFVADGEDRAWPFAAIHGVALRALSTARPGRLELVVYDPRIRGVTSPFAALRKAGSDLLGEPLATSTELTARLSVLRAAVTRVAELAGAHGVADLGELAGATGVQPEPYRLLVVCDYPYGVDARAQGELLRLAEGGPRRGVSLLVHHDPAIEPDTGVQPADLLRHVTMVRGRNSAVTVSVLPGVEVRPDPVPPRTLLETVASRIAEGARRGAAPVVDFGALLPEFDRLWRGSAVHGVTARIGRSGLDTVELELRGSDPALPNVLIGGASGQGKSNLLLVLLHSIAATYPPDEVAMYLLDFKEGLEFDRLGPRPGKPWSLPHAKVLGLEGDRAFGLATLRHLDAEFRRRAERFRSAGHNSLAAYRIARPDEVVPRLLLVIDEFQVLIAEDDDAARESIAILETLARRGRAVGVHLVLASQTLSGIETLMTKERSIFGQFPWRLSLKTAASESEAVLGRENTEAAQLRFRGEVVLNAEYGDPAHNRRAVVAYADERQLDDLRRGLWEKADTPRPPRVFYAGRPSDAGELPAALQRVVAASPATDDTRHAVLGLPVDVDPAPVTFGLTTDPGRTLAIIGEGRADAFGLFGSIAWSLAAQDAAGGAEFVLLDAIGGEAGAPETALVADAARGQGQQVTVHNGPAVGPALIELGRLVDARLAERSAVGGGVQRPVYVLGLGLHRAVRLDRFTTAGAPTDALRKLVREGPLVGVHLLAWWNTLRVFSEHVSYDFAPTVGGYVFLRVPHADVQAVLGAFVRPWVARPHRGLACDVAHGGVPTVLVPFGLPGGPDSPAGAPSREAR